MSTLIYTKSIKCSMGIIHLRVDQIIEIQVNHQIEITDHEIEEMISIFKQLSPHPLPALFDHRIPHSFSYHGLVALSNTTNINGLALIVTKGVNKRIAEYLQQFACSFPIQIFEKKRTAIAWAMNYVQHEKGILNK